MSDDPPPSVQIVEAVARREGCDVENLPPLDRGCDTGCIDELIEATRNVSLEVEYMGYAIWIGPDGSIEFVGPALHGSEESSVE